MPDVHLNAVDATELSELLTFLNDRLDRDERPLTASPAKLRRQRHLQHQQPARGLSRFVFLLGDDGEALFGDRTR